MTSSAIQGRTSRNFPNTNNNCLSFYFAALTSVRQKGVCNLNLLNSPWQMQLALVRSKEVILKNSNALNFFASIKDVLEEIRERIRRRGLKVEELVQAAGNRQEWKKGKHKQTQCTDKSEMTTR